MAQLVQDYGFRLYNPAIGRFLSVDPLAPDYPWYTPYQFAGNKPIWAVDLDGLEEWETNNGIEFGPYSSEYAESQGWTTKKDDFSSNSNEIPQFEIDEPFLRDVTSRPSPPSTFIEGVGVVTAQVGGIQWDEAENSIGDAEGLSSAIPLYGSGRSAINAFQNKRIVTGTLYSFMTLGDVFLLKSAAQGTVRLGYAYRAQGMRGVRKLYGIGYVNSYGAATGRWDDLGNLLDSPANIAGLNNIKHHSLISRAAADRGRNGIVGFLGNGVWNMKSMPNQAIHTSRAHWTGFNPPMMHFWTGRYQARATPNWYRGLILSVGTRKLEEPVNGIGLKYNIGW